MKLNHDKFLTQWYDIFSNNDNLKDKPSWKCFYTHINLSHIYNSTFYNNIIC